MIFFLPLIILLLTMGQAHAYTTQTPEISGFNNRTMKLTGGSGGFSGGNYARTGTVLINGKTVPIPGSLKPSSTMGNIVKNALKLNPYKIAGTLAAAWLIEQGIEWFEDSKQWKKTDLSSPVPEYPDSSTWGHNKTGYSCYISSPTVTPGCDLRTAINQIVQKFWAGSTLNSYTYMGQLDANTRRYSISLTSPTGDPYTIQDDLIKGAPFSGTPSQPTVVMTDAEWNALADPMPTVGAELPTAEYLPEGVTIVEPPAYIPQTVTVGAPYTKADGSTAQPMAKISPAGDGQVTIDTYEQPLTNPDGTPVPSGTPSTDTTEQPEPPKDPCIENPGRLGCMEAGADEYALPKKEVAFTFTPEASPIGPGSCPAPISVLGQSLSYQPACDAMNMIKPLVLALSSMMAAYILLGAFKGGD